MLLQIKYRSFKYIVVNVCLNLQINFAQSVGKYDVIINQKVKLQKIIENIGNRKFFGPASWSSGNEFVCGAGSLGL